MRARLGARAGGPHQGRAGYALAVAISILSVVFVLGLAYSTRTQYHLFNTTRTVSSIQSQYLDEAGVQYALANWNGQQPFQQTLTFDTGTVSVAANNQTIISHARAGRGSRTLVVTVDANGNVVQWKESVP